VANARLRRRLAADDSPTSRPDAALVDVLRIPEKFISPGQRIFRRVVYATLVLFATVLVVYLDRDGYRDAQEGFAIAEREVENNEVGGSARHLSDVVLGVVRNGRLLRIDSPEVDGLKASDRLLYVRGAER
jgi:hypothetical protein